MDIRSDGVDFSCVDLGKGPAILLLLNESTEQQTVLPFLETLVGQGYRVICPENFGEADRVVHSSGTVAGTLIRLLDYLGVGRVVFLAETGNADVLEQLLKQYPQRLAGSWQIRRWERFTTPDCGILEFLDQLRQGEGSGYPLPHVA
ncbi:MAG: hypothetical protein P8X63_03100 [Desulfuromonadaceae bacterium]|jgi:hypothetical protein